MAPLIRQTQKVFASNANADQLAVFGSMKTGTPIYSTALSALQSQEYTEGWSEALLNDKAPFLEEMNAVQYGLSYQIAYLLQEGVPAYDSNTEYSSTSIVKVINNNELEFYHSLSDGNIGNPLTDTTNWARVYFTNTGQIGQPQFTLNFNSLPTNCIWLEGAEVSRTTYANLFAIYGTVYGEGDGSTTFNLPDCRNRVFWGGSEAGYISAGLPNITGAFNTVVERDKRYVTGAFTETYIQNASVEPEGNVFHRTDRFSFNASRSSSVYGGSSTVQPPAIKVRVYTRYQ
jgi:hypothetical protein